MTIPELGMALLILAAVLLAILLLGRVLGAQERRTLEAERAQAAQPPVLLGQEERGALLAAVSAALAEEMGTGVSALRIVEWKRLS